MNRWVSLFSLIAVLFLLSSIFFVHGLLGEIDMIGVVARVWDGDTFDLESGVRVRLADINASEMGDPGYAEARDFLISIVYDETVYLDVDDEYTYDDEGEGSRLVCVVYVDYNGTHYLNVNKALLVEGHATIWEHDNQFNPYSWKLYVPIDEVSEPPPPIELPWAAGNYFPEPDSVDVPLDTNISISFGRPPSIVNMSLSPEVPIKERTFESIWVAGGKYTFHLAELLEPSTTYTVTMVFGQESAPEDFAPISTRTWNFTTKAQSTEPTLPPDPDQTGFEFPTAEVIISTIIISLALVTIYYLKRKPEPKKS